MTTNTHDVHLPEGDDPGVLSDIGNPDTISIPLLGGATAHLAVELHSDEDDDDEGDVIDDSIELSFDSLIAGTLDVGAADAPADTLGRAGSAGEARTEDS